MLSPRHSAGGYCLVLLLTKCLERRLTAFRRVIKSLSWNAFAELTTIDSTDTTLSRQKHDKSDVGTTKRSVVGSSCEGNEDFPKRADLRESVMSQ
jgi:hypothetical protein